VHAGTGVVLKKGVEAAKAALSAFEYLMPNPFEETEKQATPAPLHGYKALFNKLIGHYII
jgi:hypothetical protein